MFCFIKLKATYQNRNSESEYWGAAHFLKCFYPSRNGSGCVRALPEKNITYNKIFRGLQDRESKIKRTKVTLPPVNEPIFYWTGVILHREKTLGDNRSGNEWAATSMRSAVNPLPASLFLPISRLSLPLPLSSLSLACSLSFSEPEWSLIFSSPSSCSNTLISSKWFLAFWG